jgi:hypothetical protein
LSARFAQLAGAGVWTFAHFSEIASDRLICGNRAGWFLFALLDTLSSQLDCGIQGRFSNLTGRFTQRPIAD